MSSSGARLRAYMEARYLQLGLGKRHGFVSDMSRRTGILRSTMHNWFTASATPRLDALEEIARELQVPRAALVAAFDGTDLSDQLPEPSVVADAERRRRRAWWLRIARETTPLNLGEANAALAAAGFRSERGELVSIWENPRARLEPNDAQVRALADIYRIPRRAFVELWNSPLPTDEETMAERRGVRIEAVEAPPADERPERPARRRQAS